MNNVKLYKNCNNRPKQVGHPFWTWTKQVTYIFLKLYVVSLRSEWGSLSGGAILTLKNSSDYLEWCFCEHDFQQGSTLKCIPSFICGQT